MIETGKSKSKETLKENLEISRDIDLPISKYPNDKVPQENSNEKENSYSSSESDYDSDLDRDHEEKSDGCKNIESAATSQINIRIHDSNKKSSKKSSWFRKYRGILLAILSSLIFSVSALVVKKLKGFDPFNVTLYRLQGAFLPGLLILLQKVYCSKKEKKVVENVWPLTKTGNVKRIGLVLLRSILSCNALLLHIFSLKFLPMGDALTISAASPIFVSILAKIFLGEKCGYSTIFASIFSLAGVVAIAKPPLFTGGEEFSYEVLIGTCLAFGCTIVSAISYITLRYIRKVHYSVTTLMYGAWGTLENLVIVLIIPGLIIPHSIKEICLVVGMALLTLLGQFAIILAMKSEQAGPVALVRTFDVFFAFLLEIVVYGKLPDISSLVGAAVIVLSVLFIGMRKWIRSFPKDHAVRRNLRFIC